MPYVRPLKDKLALIPVALNFLQDRHNKSISTTPSQSIQLPNITSTALTSTSPSHAPPPTPPPPPSPAAISPAISAGAASQSLPTPTLALSRRRYTPTSSAI